MPSLADFVRARNRDLVLRMSPADRMTLALELGDDAVAMYARRQGISPDDARRRLSAQRQRGRTFSAVAVAGPRVVL